MTTLKVSCPAELISAVPFVVGFHPADSLIVVAMRGTRITCAMRADLPEDGAPEEEAREAVLHLATVVLRQQVEAVAIIGYGEEPRVTPAVLRISATFRKAHVTIVDELRVTDGRYWSYLCTDVACCPSEGLRCEPAFSVVATAATYAGAVALPSREALAEQLTPATGDDRAAMTGATARAVLRLAALAAELPAEGGLAGDPGGGRPAVEGAEEAAPGDPPPAEASAADPESQKAAERSAPRDGAAEPIRSDVRAAQIHDQKAPHLVAAATSTASGPGPTELRLTQVIGSGPGAPAQLPDQPETAAEGLDLLSDEAHFFAQVRSAGRTAVREAERRYRTGGRLTDDDAAWLGVLLLNTAVRDYAWTRARTHEWELALWSDLLRRVEPRYRPAPASLLAFVAWRMGLGPLAGIAVERALDEKLDYPLANLMQGVLAAGLPPSVLDGWPAVAGMPTVDPGPDADDDPRPDVPVHFGPGEDAEPEGQDRSEPGDRAAEPDPHRSARRGQLPVRRRSDPAPADSGDRPGRRDKRQRKAGRASRRRI